MSKSWGRRSKEEEKGGGGLERRDEAEGDEVEGENGGALMTMRGTEER